MEYQTGIQTAGVVNRNTTLDRELVLYKIIMYSAATQSREQYMYISSVAILDIKLDL